MKIHPQPTKLQALVLRLFAAAGAQSVLDVGCGPTGTWAKLIANRGLDVVGVDPRARPIDIPGLKLYRCKHQELASSIKFDAAIVVFVLHSLSNGEREEILTKLFTTNVKPTGSVIVIDYQLAAALDVCSATLLEVLADELLASALELSLSHFREFWAVSFDDTMRGEIQSIVDRTEFRGSTIMIGYPRLEVVTLLSVGKDAVSNT